MTATASSSAPHRTPVEVGVIAQMLAERMDSLVIALQLQGRREGNKFVAFNPTRADTHLGSFVIDLYGGRAGVWADFAVSRAKGDALDLVAYVSFGGDKRRAIGWAKIWLGLDEGSADLPAAVRRAQAVKAKPKDDNPYKGAAQALWIEARAIVRATPVELYLAGRAVDLALLATLSVPAGRLPGAVRYHPGLKNPENSFLYPAMVASVQDGEGRFLACHRTWLCEHADADGEIERVTKAPLTDAKRTLGRYAHVGGFIPIWRGKSGKPIKEAPAGDTVAICEGIEDAYTVALAVPDLRVICAITLSNMGNVALPDQITDVILIADNDKGEQAIRALGEASDQHRRKDRRVRIARAGGGAKDMNERLAQKAKEGASHVR